MEKTWNFILLVDPSKIGTAQQKKFDPRTRRFFTPKKVANGIRAIAAQASIAARKKGAFLPAWGRPVKLAIHFFYSIPKTLRKNPRIRPVEGSPCTAMWAGDCDNRAKSVIDALTKAGFWPDDRFVTQLAIRKSWTGGTPKIWVAIAEDADMMED